MDRDEFEQVGVLVDCLHSAVYDMLHAMHSNFANEFSPIDDETPQPLERDVGT